jgi:hypothetical protein
MTLSFGRTCEFRWRDTTTAVRAYVRSLSPDPDQSHWSDARYVSHLIYTIITHTWPPFRCFRSIVCFLNLPVYPEYHATGLLSDYLTSPGGMMSCLEDFRRSDWNLRVRKRILTEDWGAGLRLDWDGCFVREIEEYRYNRYPLQFS